MEVALLASTLSFFFGATLAIVSIDIILRLRQSRRPVFLKVVHDVPRQSLGIVTRQYITVGWKIAGMSSIGKVGTCDILFQAMC
jgi:hypothetical protein